VNHDDTTGTTQKTVMFVVVSSWFIFWVFWPEEQIAVLLTSW